MYYPGGRESHWIQESAQNSLPPVRLEHYLFDYDVPGQSLRLVQEGRGESFWRWDALGQKTAIT